MPILSFQAVGGFVIADSAQVTDGSHMVIADDDLANEAAQRLLTWVQAGKGPADVMASARQMGAGRGDLMMIEATPSLTVDEVKRLLAERGIEGAEAARTVVGDPEQVSGMSVLAFQILASQDSLPSVVVLSVAVRLQDKAGNTYTLLLMA